MKITINIDPETLFGKYINRVFKICEILIKLRFNL